MDNRSVFRQRPAAEAPVCGAALEDRARYLYSAFSAIVAQNPIVPDTYQSRRQDMQAEAPDELWGVQG
jgi:hypothetical protein